jgi:hypothetical protein
MATTSRLSLYNGALRELGERQLASLSENREPRRMLDAAWDDNAVQRALEAGCWLFASRSQEYTYSPSVEPEWGFRRAFNKPDDFVRTCGIYGDEYMRIPLTAQQYRDEAGYWFSDLDTLYITYVSNDASYGLAMARWPQSFVKYLEALLACDIAQPLKGNRQARTDMEGLMDKRLVEAQSQNAMAEGAKFLPVSGWVRSRMGGRNRSGYGNGRG